MAIACSILMACTSTNTSTKSAETVTAIDSTIPYKIADGYFVSNEVKQPIAKAITTEAEFNTLFGMATVMGENGKPTPIDFTKEYVIALTLPETDRATELTPISLAHTSDNGITFRYSVTVGEQHTYTITPCLLLIVSTSHKAPITFLQTPTN